MTTLEGIFEQAQTFPNPDAQDRLACLIGIDQQIDTLSKTLTLLVNQKKLAKWAQWAGIEDTRLLETIRRRPPLVVLAGDVGSGKTELAETVGDLVARQSGIDITLLPLSLSTRGQGRVGEMTHLISTAFDYAISEGEKLTSKSGSSRGAVILLVDEADALAQSREAAQMHHEDKAGVNALIRGIDRIKNSRAPIAVIMCTNRLSALDPAIQRRACVILKFNRPNDYQRKAVFKHYFAGADFSDSDIGALVDATGKRDGKPYGFTFSDITQRLIPAIILDAFPHKRIEGAKAAQIAKSIVATTPFREEAP